MYDGDSSCFFQSYWKLCKGQLVVFFVVDSHLFEFFIMYSMNSLNPLLNKIIFITIEKFQPAISRGRGQDATTEPARHTWETGS